jgi:hypothetical protein
MRFAGLFTMLPLTISRADRAFAESARAVGSFCELVVTYPSPQTYDSQ